MTPFQYNLATSSPHSLYPEDRGSRFSKTPDIYTHISVNEDDKIGLNVTFTKDLEKLEMNDISARVMNVTEVVDQPNSATEAVPEQLAMSHSRPTLWSSAIKMATTQKFCVQAFC
jgi:hypothetical protein